MNNKTEPEIKKRIPSTLRYCSSICGYRLLAGALYILLMLYFEFNDSQNPIYAISKTRAPKDVTSFAGYLIGEYLAVICLLTPVFMATKRQSRRWLLVARITTLLLVVSDFQRLAPVGFILDLVLLCLLFSKRTKEYLSPKPNSIS